ncbi:MAG TPA: glycoside hydrolase family 57 protein [Candidatus Kapabacteria bacterium]|jgi:alpha-amylase/alpha-mannosidase (GH57 family)|nr:glycoside hydrolase family 57 protein [Candidatus Kapabacteria bacterium]
MDSSVLKIAFLWHNHQPYYAMDGKFLLPWVRFHSIKDYRDLPLLFREFPKIKHNINIVPSLFLQILQYIQHQKIDRVQELTLINAEYLTIDEKKEILFQFFVCNEKHLIKPYPRYYELYIKSKNENAIEQFTSQDYRDLQVWYNLCWFGNYARKEKPIADLFLKSSNFSEADKIICLEYQCKIMNDILPLLNEMQKNSQIEISTTSFYHPIIPLIIDTNCALEANPNNPKLEQPFQFPQDAALQIIKAKEFYKDIFGFYPIGAWPSEGAVSNEAICLIADCNFQWIATDESILFASESSTTGLEKYFPRKYKNQNREIMLFFRDHYLSDKIGFDYQNWNSFDAVNDFIGNLHNIRNAILEKYGQEGLNAAVVPIILDGENCWEYYENNGEDFLSELFSRLSESNYFTTVRFSDILNDGSDKFLPELSNIRAGSWINANFDIWIGTDVHIKAWNILKNARITFENNRKNLPENIENEILNEIMIAEGSDWFWWYSPFNQSENKKDFDILFRYHIKRIYDLMQIPAPEDVQYPINGSKEANQHANSTNANSTMHRAEQ